MSVQFIELFVNKTDGSGYTALTARDDAFGRREIDDKAFRLLARADVESLSTVRADRVAGYLRSR